MPLCSFGLSEDIYIRMNARGKILTDFENFKSEFYKIIKNYPRIELIKDKMEYAWVNHLWPYRKHDKKNPVFVTDDCFMNYLRFISEMLYFNQAKPRNESGYASDFSDFKLLGHLYSNPENVDFLMFALDAIPKLSQLKLSCVHFWQGRENQELSFSDILSRAIRGENLVFDNKLVLYAAIAYIKKHGDCVLVKDYIRIVRNLIVNTDDKSERDRPRILSSIIKFAENKDPYLALKAADFKLEGLRESQCTEEHFKACIGLANEFAEIEDLALFKGNIKSLIAASYSPTEHKIADFHLMIQRFTLLIWKSSRQYTKAIALLQRMISLVSGETSLTPLCIATFNHQEDWFMWKTTVRMPGLLPWLPIMLILGLM